MKIKKEIAFNTHEVIGYSGNLMMVVDWNFDTVSRICRIRILNKDSAEQITQFYLDKNAIDNLKAILNRDYARV